MTALHLPDVSEFQPNVDWKQVAAHNGGAAIIRAFNGYRVDKAWYGGARRAQAHKDGIRVLGIYAYLVPTRPVLDQARDLVQIVGALRPGEFIVCDFEDPGFHGDRHGDVEVWLNYVDQHLTYPGYHGAWLYSYAWFIKNHGVASIFAGPRHTWLAAYERFEPAIPLHSLWQHSSSEAWPGIGKCDCSIFWGPLTALEAKVWQRPQPVPPAPAPRPVVHTPPPPIPPSQPPAQHRPAPQPAVSPQNMSRLMVLLRQLWVLLSTIFGGQKQ